MMEEQLDYLVDHVTNDMTCSVSCPICDRYLRVKMIMLEIFAVTPPQSVV